jgi:hypothetical protein
MSGTEATKLAQLGYRSAEEEATLLDCTQGTLANWRSKGKGPPWVEIAGRIYYPDEGTRRYLAARVVEPEKLPPTLIQNRSSARGRSART